MTYARLQDVKDEDKGTSYTTAQEGYIMRTLRMVSARIANIAGGKGYDFEPRYKQHKFTPSGTRINSLLRTFRLDKDLLEITSITSDGTALVEGTDVYAEPLGEFPIRVLRIDPDTATSWWPCNSTCDPFNTIAVTGFWGFRRYYDEQGFLSVDAVADVAGITSSSASVKVADADGADYYGITPRFSPGDLIRMENELCEVTATDTTTNTLTILRAQRGTTAAAHSNGTAVKIWNIEEPIRRVTARQAAYIYARKGAFTQAEITDFGTVTFPPDFVIEVYRALQELA